MVLLWAMSIGWIFVAPDASIQEEKPWLRQSSKENNGKGFVGFQ
jgi:hypothetical protein